MDYKKKYEDAIKRAKKLYEQGTITESFSYVFPELAESEDEKIRKSLLEMVHDTPRIEYEDYNVSKEDIIAWLEKQEKQASAIRWYDVSLIPQEMEELLVEWDSEDATWHEIAFYHADTKTFWDGERQVENVTRWCYIDDIIKKQEPKQKWSNEDSLMIDSIIDTMKWLEGKGATNMKIDWLRSLKQRMEEQL